MPRSSARRGTGEGSDNIPSRTRSNCRTYSAPSRTAPRKRSVTPGLDLIDEREAQDHVVELPDHVLGVTGNRSWASSAAAPVAVSE